MEIVRLIKNNLTIFQKDHIQMTPASRNIILIIFIFVQSASRRNDIIELLHLDISAFPIIYISVHVDF